jgi:hypothetical protein
MKWYTPLFLACKPISIRTSQNIEIYGRPLEMAKEAVWT